MFVAGRERERGREKHIVREEERQQGERRNRSEAAEEETRGKPKAGAWRVARGYVQACSQRACQ